MTTFRPVDLPPAAGSLAVAGVMVALIIPTASAWAAAGGTLGRILAGGRSRRVANVVMGVLLGASVALAWI